MTQTNESRDWALTLPLSQPPAAYEICPLLEEGELLADFTPRPDLFLAPGEWLWPFGQRSYKSAPNAATLLKISLQPIVPVAKHPVAKHRVDLSVTLLIFRAS